MKSQVYFGTETGIISKEAVKVLKALITKLNSAVRTLDASGGARHSRRVVDVQAMEELLTRRCNLIATIAVLKDHLQSVENLRSHDYHPPIFDPDTPEQFWARTNADRTYSHRMQSLPRERASQ